jgi:hypothetical protein
MPRVEFTLNGIRHTLDAAAVRTALRGGAPENVREHWVDVDGVRWPPKQALARATGLDRAEFTSHIALRQLQRLGFPTSAWRGGSAAVPAARERPMPAGRQEAVPAHASPTSTIVLVGCSGSKTTEPAPAAELFTGTAFRKAKELARAAGVPWYVISAKFGLLHPDEFIAPYDVYLPDQSGRYRAAWGRWVVAQIAERHELRGAVIEAHAGRAYCEPLVEPLTEVGASLFQPLAGLGLGKRLSWYSHAAPTDEREAAPAATAIPDVMMLLDEAHAMTPADFLAAGRLATNRPGLYSWWVDVPGAQELSAGLGHRVAPGLIYAGRAGGHRPNGSASTNTLWGRVGEMHMGGNRSFSTFRLTLTACLSPASGPPITEAALTEWMHRRLRVAALPLPPEAVTAGEARLLQLTDPPLNLRDVPGTPLRRTLSRRRSALKDR